MTRPLRQSELERWRHIPTAIVADVSSGACLIDPEIRPLLPIGQQPRLFGRAVTAQCEEADLGAVLRALDMVDSGDVLVIAANGHRHHAMIGEILGGQLRRKGGVGLICDGAIRDVAELGNWKGFSVFTRHITPRGPTGFAAGNTNVAVAFGGLTIAPGDLIIGDADGLCALTPALARNLLGDAEAKLSLEAQWQQKLASGASVANTFGLTKIK